MARGLRGAEGGAFDRVAMVCRPSGEDVRAAFIDRCRTVSAEGAGMDTVGLGLAGMRRIGRMHAGNIA